MSSLILHIILSIIDLLLQDECFLDENGQERSTLSASLDKKHLNSVSWPYFLVEYLKTRYGKKVVSSLNPYNTYKKDEIIDFAEFQKLFKAFSNVVQKLRNEVSCSDTRRASSELYSCYFYNKFYRTSINKFFVESVKGYNTDCTETVVNEVIEDLVSCVVETISENNDFVLGNEGSKAETKCQETEQNSLFSEIPSHENCISILEHVKAAILTTSFSRDISNKLLICVSNLECQLQMTKAEEVNSKIPSINIFDDRSWKNNLTFVTLLKQALKIRSGNFISLSIEEKCDFLEALANTALDTEILAAEITYIANEISNIEEVIEETTQDYFQSKEQIDANWESSVHLFQTIMNDLKIYQLENTDPFIGLPFVSVDENNAYVSGVISKRLRYWENKLKKDISEYFLNNNFSIMSILEHPELGNIRYKCVLDDGQRFRINLYDLCRQNVLGNLSSTKDIVFPFLASQYSSSDLTLFYKKGRTIFVSCFGFGTVIKFNQATNTVITKFSYGTGYISLSSIIYIYFDSEKYLELYRSGFLKVNLGISKDDIKSEFDEKIFKQKKKLEQLEQRYSIRFDKNLVFRNQSIIIWQIENYFLCQLEQESHCIYKKDLLKHEPIFLKPYISHVTKYIPIYQEINKMEHITYFGKYSNHILPFISQARRSKEWVDENLILIQFCKRLIISYSCLLTKDMANEYISLLTLMSPNINTRSSIESCAKFLLLFEEGILSRLTFSIQNNKQTAKRAIYTVLATVGIDDVLPPVKEDFPFDVSEIFYLSSLKKKPNGHRLTAAELVKVEGFVAALISYFFNRFFQSKGYKVNHLSNAQIKDYLSYVFNNGFQAFERALFHKYQENLLSTFSRDVSSRILKSDTRSLFSKTQNIEFDVNQKSVLNFLVEWSQISISFRKTLKLYNNNMLSSTKLLLCLHALDQALSLLELQPENSFFSIGDLLVYDKRRHKEIEIFERFKSKSLYPLPLYLSSMSENVGVTGEYLGNNRSEQYLSEYEIYYIKYYSGPLPYAVVTVGKPSVDFKSTSFKMKEHRSTYKYLFEKRNYRSAISEYTRKQKFCFICLCGGVLASCDVKSCFIHFHVTCLRHVEVQTTCFVSKFFACPVHAILSCQFTKTSFINLSILRSIDFLLSPSSSVNKAALYFMYPFTGNHKKHLLIDPALPCLTTFRIKALRNDYVNYFSLERDLFAMRDMLLGFKQKFPTLLKLWSIVKTALVNNFKLAMKFSLEEQGAILEEKKQTQLLSTQRRFKEKQIYHEREISELLEYMVRQVTRPTREIVAITPSPKYRRSSRKRKQFKQFTLNTEPSYKRSYLKTPLSENTKKNKMLLKLKSNLSTPPIRPKTTCHGCTNCVIRSQNTTNSFLRVAETSCLSESIQEEETAWKFRYRGFFMDSNEFLHCINRDLSLREVNRIWSQVPRCGVETYKGDVYTFVLPLTKAYPKFITTRSDWQDVRTAEKQN